MKRNFYHLLYWLGRSMPLLLAAWCTAVPSYSQSGSFGNTFITSGAEMAVHGSTSHHFQNGGSGVLPGIVGTERTASQGFFGFVGTAAHSGAADNAHVDGYVRSYRSDPFVFPIGDNGKYRPAAVSTAAIAAPAAAAYFGVNPSVAITSSIKGGNEPILPAAGPFSTTALGLGVLVVDAKEYWDIDGATAARITLSWDAASAISTLTLGQLSSLTIVGWNGSQWVAIPSTVDATSILGAASSLATGSITTNAALAPDTYNIYTLGALVADTDGDGIVDASDSAPNDPCTPAQAAGYTGYNAANSIWAAADCDGDGLSNGTENTNASDPYNRCSPITASSADADNDGLTDCEETTGLDNPSTPANPNGNTSNPNDGDTDNDGLNDGAEGTNGSNPNSSDTDGDGLSDNEEVTGIDDPGTPGNPNGNTSSPSNGDTDGDGLNDCDESSICVPNGTPTSALFGNTHVFSGAETGLFGVVSMQGVSTTDRSAIYGAFSFTKMATWVNASDAGHIDGYVKKYGATPFTFPVGDNGKYRPIAMSGFTTSGNTATGAYFAAAPVSPSAKAANVASVSTVEYWEVKGSATTQLTLTWDAASGVSGLASGQLSNLTILGWDGSQWVAIPSTVSVNGLNVGSACREFGVTPSSLSVGSITSNAGVNLGNYQAYTLGGLGIDSDLDGLVDSVDQDDDNDGILDTVEDASACAITVSASGTDADCDGDGTPNRLDLDSDGDGIKDVIEAGGTDPDNDGRVGSGTPSVDANGVPTAVSGGLTPPNSDSAAGADPYDLDSDGDNIPDGIEDTDKDGVVDAGETDPKDTDTDNDGINDGIEDTDKDGAVDAGETDPSDTDTDNDNIPDGIEDTDKDGVVDAGETDPRDADTDNDGLNDGVEDADQDGIVDPTETDPADADTDNDGLTDKEEKDNVDDPSTALVPAGTSDPLNICDPITASSADADNDGLTDCEETTGLDNPSTPANPNGNTSNPNDGDTDNDGLNDGAEATNDSNPNSSDTDGDGLSDNEEVTGIDDPSTPGNPNGNTSSPSNSDTDGDGLNDCDESSICVPNGTPTSALFGNTHVFSGAETGLFGVVSMQGVSTTDRSASYGAFSFTKMASWVNASDAGHIDGYVKKYGATPFTFPVGDNGAFRPASMSGFATSGQTATAAYFAAAPVSPSALGPGVSAVSAVEYWDIDGTAATRLTLTWDAASNVTALTGSSLSALTILGWNGSQWVAIPSTVAATTLNESSACSEFTATAGTLTVGAITTNVALNPGTYQYYTLGALSAKLNVKVLLQGALFNTATPGLMRDDLRSGAHLPLNDPYTGSGNVRFTHYGAGALATTTNTVLNANAGTNDAIVDWVFVELRSSANAATVIETRAALVQRDGDVVSPVDGTSPLNFSGLAGQSFYVSVKHRNHLGAMTAAPIALTNVGTTVDFTTMTNADLYNQAGYDGAEMVTVGAVRALWAGNANANTNTKYQGTNNDGAIVLSEVLNHPGNTASTYNFDLGFGYWYGDINMDGKVKYQGAENDPSFIFYNLITSYTLNGFDLYNYDLMREQLP